MKDRKPKRAGAYIVKELGYATQRRHVMPYINDQGNFDTDELMHLERPNDREVAYAHELYSKNKQLKRRNIAVMLLGLMVYGLLVFAAPTGEWAMAGLLTLGGLVAFSQY